MLSSRKAFDCDQGFELAREQGFPVSAATADAPEFEPSHEGKPQTLGLIDVAQGDSDMHRLTWSIRMRALAVALLGLVFSSSAPSTALCVSPPHVWSQRFGDVQNDRGLAITTDGADNVLVTGRFEGTADFGGGPFTSAGVSDVFIAKYDAGGTHLWSRRFGDSSSDQGLAIVTDETGNVLVTGSFQGVADFGGGPLTSAGSLDIFVAKYDATGTHLWSQRFGDTGPDVGSAIATDGAGNVMLAGHFSGTADFGGGPLTSVGSVDIFVAKYGEGGTHSWSQRFGDTTSDQGRGIVVGEAGTVLVTGFFHGTVDFGGGPLTSAGVNDIFVAKYSPDGAHLWSRRFGGASGDVGFSIAADGAGDVVVTGEFRNTVDFGGGALTSAGVNDIFVAKYDAGGTHLWSRRFGDPSEDAGFAVATDGADNVLVTGWFWGTVNLGGESFSSMGEWDMFVAKYDATTGDHIWSRSFGGIGWDAGDGIAVDGSGNVLLTGGFEAEVDFGGGPLTSAGWPPGGGDDIFVVKYGPDPTGILEHPAVPDVVLRAHPNPFNPAVLIAYSIPVSNTVNLTIYDVYGHVVRSLVRDTKIQGEHTVTWNGCDDRNTQVSTGVYFLRLETGGQVVTRKVVLLK